MSACIAVAARTCPNHKYLKLRLLRDLKAARKASGTRRDNVPLDVGVFCAWMLLNSGLGMGEVYARGHLAPKRHPECLSNHLRLTRFKCDRANVYLADLVAHTDMD